MTMDRSYHIVYIYFIQRYTERDQVIVEDLEKLMNKTEKRSGKISEITDNLEGELTMLAGFLENLATRRPRGRCIYGRGLYDVQDIYISLLSP